MSRSPPLPSQIVFIIGPPRSGTSLVLDFLSAHPDMGWVDDRLDASPGELSLAKRIRCFDTPWLGEFRFERRFARPSLPQPAENGGFWRYWLPGFDPDPGCPAPPEPHVTHEAAVLRARQALASLCALQRRDRFVGQHTGFPRVALLRRVFPEARFIQCLRDPRSVAWWMAKQIEKEENHPLWSRRAELEAAMPPGLAKRLGSLEKTPLNFAGVMVRWYHERTREELARLPEAHHKAVAYADLLSHPADTLRRLFGWLGLRDCRRIRTYLQYHNIHDNNRRRRREMSERESEQLEHAVAQTLT